MCLIIARNTLSTGLIFHPKTYEFLILKVASDLPYSELYSKNKLNNHILTSPQI